MIEPKPTEEQPEQFDRENTGIFRKFWVVLVCFETALFVSVVLIRFATPKQTKIFIFGFTKQTETQPKQILFRLISF